MDGVKVRAGRDRGGRCPYCRDAVQESDPACAACGARVHAECRAELRRCPTLACGAEGGQRTPWWEGEDELQEVRVPRPGLTVEEESLLERPRTSFGGRTWLRIAGWAFRLAAPLLLAIAAVFLLDWRLRSDPLAGVPAIALVTAILSPISVISLVGLAWTWGPLTAARHVLQHARPEVMRLQVGRGVALWRQPVGEKDVPALWFPWERASGDRALLSLGNRSVRVWRTRDRRGQGVVVIDDGSAGS